MPIAQKIARLDNRIRWELYIKRMLRRRRRWDALRGPEAEQRLLASRRHEAQREEHPLCGPQTEYLYDYQAPAVIEPENGYVIAEPAVLLDEALLGCENLRQLNRNLATFWAIPDPGDYTSGRCRRFPTRREKAVINMRHIWDGNYFHFYQDNLLRLKMLDDCGIDRDIPLLFGPKIAKSPFFQQCCERGMLDGRRWLIHEDFHIQTDRVIFARSGPYHRERLDFLLDAMRAPCADAAQNQRVFLTRSVKSHRYLTNLDELEPVLDEFGFRVVDTGILSMAEQMTLFSETRFCVGIHGAGLSNMMFRRGGPFSLLDILPPTQQPICFHILADVYGFTYRSVIGTAPAVAHNNMGGRHNTPFRLEPERLRESIANLLAA